MVDMVDNVNMVDSVVMVDNINNGERVEELLP